MCSAPSLAQIQTAYRDLGARLQSVADRKQRAEYEMQRHEKEMKPLKGWRNTVESMVDRFHSAVASIHAAGRPAGISDRSMGGALGDVGCTPSTGSALEEGNAADEMLPHAFMQLSKLRNQFVADVHKQLYTENDDRHFFDCLKVRLSRLTAQCTVQ